MQRGAVHRVIATIPSDAIFLRAQALRRVVALNAARVCVAFLLLVLLGASRDARADTYPAITFWLSNWNKVVAGGLNEADALLDCIAHIEAAAPGVYGSIRLSSRGIWYDYRPVADCEGFRISDGAGPFAIGYVHFYEPAGCPWGGVLSGSVCINGPACPAGQSLDPVLGTCRPFSVQKNAGTCQPGTLQTPNPITAGTGNKVHVDMDYAGTRLRFERIYNSVVTIPLTRWDHNHQSSVAPGQTLTKVRRRDGKVLLFVYNSTNQTWSPDGDVNDRLVELKDGGGVTIGWKYTDSNDNVEQYDAAGKLVSVTNRAGHTETLTYSDGTGGANGGFVLDANGNPTTTVLPAGRLIRVTDAAGRTLGFGYNAAGQLTKLTDPEGQAYRYTYDARSNYTSVLYPDGRTRTYVYNEPANTSGANLPYALTGIVDENTDRYATYRYDAQGRAVGSEHGSAMAGGPVDTHAVSYNTDGSGNPTSSVVTDPLNTQRTYTLQNILGVIKSSGASQPGGSGCGPAANTAAYDANGNITDRTDWNGNRACHAYDQTRNLETVRGEGLASGVACPGSVSSWTPAASTAERKITTAWHAVYRLPTQVAEPLRITTYVYGDPADPNPGNRGSLLSKTVQATTDATGASGFSATPVGSSRTWTYTYTSTADSTLPGLLKSIDGPRTDVADTTTYTYNPNGDLQSITNALGHVTQVTQYDAHGRPLALVDANGLVTQLAYTPRGWLSSRTVGNEVTSYTYDNAGQLTRVTLPDTSFINYTYDAAHRLTGITDTLNNRIQYTLDAIGNRVSEQVFDAGNNLASTKTRVFDALNRLWKDIGAINQTTTYAYDANGNLTSIDGPLDNITANDVRTYSYDALNRLATMVDPSGSGGGTTTYSYNGLDQLAAGQDPRTLVTTYSYDGLNNLNQQASPDTGTTLNTYDAAGNLLTQTDAKGQLTSYTYDALNRVTSITYQGGVVHTYQYDQGVNGKGRLTTIIEPASTTQYAYDQKGRLTGETRIINGVAYTTGYSYDTVGRMTGLIYPGGRTVTYTLDSLGRVSQIATTKGSTTQTVLSGVAYRPFGPIQSFAFGNGQTYTRGFDQDGRTASYTLGNQSFAVGYDAASRIASINENGNPPNSNTYTYDNLDRLLQAVLPGTPFAYSYDAVGNRLTKTVGAATDTYTYSGTSNRLSTITGGANRSYGYDANGSATGDGLNTFGYDTRGRLTQAISAIGATTYQVNSVGQRVRKTNTQGDTVYHYDAQGRLIAESNTSGQIQKEYIYLGDTPVAVIQ